jgi:hypothetical protein
MNRIALSLCLLILSFHGFGQQTGKKVIKVALSDQEKIWAGFVSDGSKMPDTLMFSRPQYNT